VAIIVLVLVGIALEWAFSDRPVTVELIMSILFELLL